MYLRVPPSSTSNYNSHGLHNDLADWGTKGVFLGSLFRYYLFDVDYRRRESGREAIKNLGGRKKKRKEIEREKSGKEELLSVAPGGLKTTMDGGLSYAVKTPARLIFSIRGSPNCALPLHPLGKLTEKSP